MVTLRVKLPAELRKTLAFTPAGTDGNFQALLYVKRGSDGSTLRDATGINAGYVAPINTTTGEAIFKLPPLPASTIDPTATPDSTNAYRFEIKVYSLGNTPANFLPAGDDYQHNVANFGTYDADADLTNANLVASGEALSTVVAGLPTAISVPRIYLHAGEAIDSFKSPTPVKMITFNTTTVQGDEIRFRLTKADTDKFSGKKTVTFTLSGAAGAGTKLALVLKNGNATYKADGTGATLAALQADLKSELDIALGGTGVGDNPFYAIGGTSPDITLTGKTSSTNLEGTLRDASSLVATGSISGGIRKVAVTPARFDIDLSGTYNSNEVVDLTFKDAAATPYLKTSIATDSASTTAIANEIAKRINADGAFRYTAVASGPKLSLTATDSAVFPEGSNFTVDATTKGVDKSAAPAADILSATIATDAVESAQGGGSGGVTYNANSFRFSTAANAGDLLIIKSKKPDGSDGPTLRYVAVAADSAMGTYLNNIGTAANTFATGQDFALAFTVTNSGGDKLTFTSNFYPGHTIATASIGAPAAGIAATVTSTQAGGDGVLAVVVGSAQTFSAQVDIEADAGDDDVVVNGDELTTTVSFTDKDGVARSTTRTTAIDTAGKAADPAGTIKADLDANTTLDDYFTITAVTTTTLRFTAKAATMDDTNPASSFPIAITRLKAGAAALPAKVTTAETKITNFAGLRALRVLTVWPSGTTFSASPTLTATDGTRTSGDVGLSLGKFHKLRGATTPVNGTDLSVISNLTRLLDLDASNGTGGPVNGPWNFSLKLNSGGAVPTIYLMDLDTAEGAGGNAIGQ